MDFRPRGAASIGMVVVQAAVLALIGAGIGIADSRIRPVNLKIEMRPGLDGGPGVIVQPLPPAESGGTAETPATDARPPAAPPSAPPPEVPAADAPPVANAAPAAFKPTDEADLAGKPGHITLQRAFDMHQFMGAVFLDARPAEEFAAGHVEGAHLAGLDRFRSGNAPEILTQIAKDSLIVVYCSGGADCEASEDVALHLNQIGFFNVHVLHDGIIGWEALGYPMAKGGGQ